MLINTRNIIVQIFACSFIISTLIGQNFQNIGLNNQDKLLRLPEALIIETQINPDTYILGPGDKIGLSVITSSNMAYILTITPSGKLWIPDIGPIYISGNNIPDAEIKVAKYIHENRFKSADVTLVILNIRHFKNQVIGAVMNPGFITISSVERLTDIIKKTGGLHKLADENNISIQRVNDGEIICSLKSFQLNGDLANNPILKEGDVVSVPYKEEYYKEIKSSISHKQNLVFVTGFVVRPSGHKFIHAYSINDYIAMSGGITDFGSMKNLSINRNGELLSPDTINYLEPGDQINIPANMKYRMLGNMSMLQTLTAMMTLYLTYQAAVN
jgi:protein involved in polysaccharide export with SLBB domain